MKLHRQIQSLFLYPTANVSGLRSNRAFIRYNICRHGVNIIITCFDNPFSDSKRKLRTYSNVIIRSNQFPPPFNLLFMSTTLTNTLCPTSNFPKRILLSEDILAWSPYFKAAFSATSISYPNFRPSL